MTTIVYILLFTVHPYYTTHLCMYVACNRNIFLGYVWSWYLNAGSGVSLTWNDAVEITFWLPDSNEKTKRKSPNKHNIPICTGLQLLASPPPCPPFRHFLFALTMISSHLFWHVLVMSDSEITESMIHITEKKVPCCVMALGLFYTTRIPTRFLYQIWICSYGQPLCEWNH